MIIMEPANRQDQLYLAKIANNIEHNEDCLEFLRRAASYEGQPSYEEAALVARCVRSDQAIQRRNAWREFLLRIHKQPVGSSNLPTLRMLQKRIALQTEMVCRKALHVLALHLSKPIANQYCLAMCLKLQGDCHRYLCEMLPPTDPSYYCSRIEARLCYTRALEIAKQHFLPTQPIRLNIAINLAAFLYEIEEDAKQAVQLSEATFQAAQGEPTLSADQRQSSQLLQKLKDNLEEWAIQVE